MFKNSIKDFRDAFSLFIKCHGPLMAGASSFFILLSIVPFLLLVLKIGGILFGGVGDLENRIFSMGKAFFPSAAPQVIDLIKNIVQGPLLASKGNYTVLNLFFLTLGCLSLFGTVSKGLRIIGESKARGIVKKLEELGLIGISILLAFLTVVIPFALNFFKHLLSNLSEMVNIFPSFTKFLSEIDIVSTLAKTQYLSNIFLWLYVAFLFGWFFKFRLKKREFLYISFIFVLLLNFAKGLYIFYIRTVRDGMVQNYGDYYTYILGMVWIYLVMSFLFYTAALCQIKIKKKGSSYGTY